jgi:hypothetical protein
MGEKQEFATYEQFFAFYLTQHSSPGNRILHACGTVIAVAVLVTAVASGHPWWGLLWVPVAYGFAWFGHLIVEGNKPATWGHPWWSFVSDFRMLGMLMTGKLRKR